MGRQKYGGRHKVGRVTSIDWGKKVKADQKAHPYTVNGRNTCTHCGGSGKVATSSHTPGTSNAITSRTRRTRKSKRRAHQSSSQEDSAQSSSDSSESSAYSVHDQSGDGNPVAEIDEVANDDDDDDIWEDVQDGQGAVPEDAGVSDGADSQDNLPGDDDGGVSQPDDQYPIHEFPLTQRPKQRESSVISISSAPVTPVSRPR